MREIFLSLFFFVFFFPSPPLFAPATQADLNKISLQLLESLSPNMHIQILQTDLYTFLLRIVERIWFKIKAFSLWLSI